MNDREAFEKIYPIPGYLKRTDTGYTKRDSKAMWTIEYFNVIEKYCRLYEGWQAAKKDSRLTDYPYHKTDDWHNHVKEIESLKADLEKIRQFNYEFAVENEQLTKKLSEAEKFIPDGAAYAFYNDQCKEG